MWEFTQAAISGCGGSVCSWAAYCLLGANALLAAQMLWVRRHAAADPAYASWWDGGGNQNQPGGRDDALAPTPPPSPEALPQTGERARVAGTHHRVERTDVDAQLQCVGRHHAGQLAIA